LNISLGHLHLVRRCLQIEIGLTDVTFHLALEVFQFGAPLSQGGISLLDVSFRPPALPNRKTKRRRSRKGAMRLSGFVPISP